MSRVLVVGDVMLDEYVYGHIDRMSPEAAVPVFVEDRREYRPGGAANVAAGVDALGGRFSLFGVVGSEGVCGRRDVDGELVLNSLAPCICRGSRVWFSIDDTPPKTRCHRRTTKKTRFVTTTGQIMRVDVEDTFDVSNYLIASLTNESRNTNQFGSLAHTMCLDNFMLHDVIVVSDYAKGFVTRELVAWLIRWNQICNKARVVVDPKHDDWSRYRGAWLITPNAKEFEAACRFVQRPCCENTVLQMLIDNDIDHALVTEGARGMSLYTKNKRARSFRAESSEVIDVVGAGDTVVAAIATCLAAHLDHTLEFAIEYANIAAGVAVRRRGTHAVTSEELKNAEGYAEIEKRWKK